MRRVYALFLALVLGGVALAGGPDLTQKLPVDPDIKQGQLENGMRYWIQANQTPPGKVEVMLHIDSGSLNEEDHQRGLAHFLEHMAFNGTKNYPADTMTSFFRSLGLAFGQHQNAFTGMNQTAYMLRLPNTLPETMDKAFLWFADVGHRLTLDIKEIDAERGVILEEKRSRSGVAMRMWKKTLPIIAPGSRIAARSPIGIEEVISKAPRKAFVDYYTKWYRPEKSVLIVVGDIDPQVIEAQIKKLFSDWPASEKSPENLPHGIVLTDKLRCAVVSDTELTGAEVSISCSLPMRITKTVGDLRAGMVDRIGTRIVNRRLAERLRKGGVPYQSASLSVANFNNWIRTGDVSVNSVPEKWQDALTDVLIEVRGAKKHGFLDAEFDRVKKAMLSRAERAASTASTRPSQRIAMGLNGAAARGRMPSSAAQRLELTKALLPTITRDEVEEAFRANYDFSKSVVIASLPEKGELPTEADVESVFSKALKAAVTKKAEEKSASKFMEKDPTPGKIKEQKKDEETGITSVLFENGVRVHLRTMDERKNQVIVNIRVLGGSIEETKENQELSGGVGLAWGMARATKNLSSTDISNLMIGKKVSVGGGPSDDALALSVSGEPAELEEGLRLAYLLLTEPKIEQAAVDRIKATIDQQLEGARISVRAQGINAMREFLTGGDIRHAVIPSRKHLMALTAEKGQAWMDRILANNPIEIAIVGDLSLERGLELATKYFGSLPSRPVSSQKIDDLRRIQGPKGPSLRVVEVPTVTPMALVLLGWRGPDYMERAEVRAMYLASRVAQTRVTKTVREEKQLAYSPSCQLASNQAYDGIGALLVAFPTKPENAVEAATVAKQVMLDLRDNGFEDAELEDVKKAFEHTVTSQLKQPGFWAGALSRLSSRGRSLQSYKDILENYKAVTKEQILAALKKHMTEERYFQVVSVPESKQEEKPEPATGDTKTPEGQPQ